MIKLARRAMLALSAVGLLSACAGTTTALVETVTGTGPFANKSLVAAFVMSIDYVEDAAKEYANGLKSVERAGLIKDAAIRKVASDLAVKLQGARGIASADVLNAEASNVQKVNEEVRKNLASTNWSQLTPDARRQLQRAYNNFVTGNYYNTQLVAGAIHIARNMSTSALAAEVLPILTGRYPGLTVDKLAEFPNTLRKFADNIDESEKVVASIEKMHDFSEAKKERETQLAADSTNRSKKAENQFPKTASTSGSGGGVLGGLGGGGLMKKPL